MTEPTPIRPLVSVAGGRRTGPQLLADVFVALQDSDMAIDMEQSGLHPTRGHELSLCLYLQDGSAFFLDAEEMER